MNVTLYSGDRVPDDAPNKRNAGAEQTTDTTMSRFRGLPSQFGAGELTSWRRFLQWLAPWLRRKRELADELLEAEVAKRSAEADRITAEAHRVEAEAQGLRIRNQADEIDLMEKMLRLATKEVAGD